MTQQTSTTQHYRNIKNVPRYIFGSGSLHQLDDLLASLKQKSGDYSVYCVDRYFETEGLAARLPLNPTDYIFYYDSSAEPKTGDIDAFVAQIRALRNGLPVCVIGIGGGCALDVAKAVANMLTNEGQAADYQGWDLVKNPAVYKIGIPTLSGTGAEASRTCVLTNLERGMKLGMNSDHTMFDQLILDSDLTKTVPRDQYFYTGMDTYFHCLESLNGRTRNVIVDALSKKAIDLTKDVFLSEDMQSEENREKMMIASYLGGTAAGNTGVLHPLSAGLSIALGTHHCLANCLVMTVLEEFYPKEHAEYQRMLQKQNIALPTGLCRGLPEETYEKLYQASIIHEKPLTNALGEGFRDILTREKLISLFQRI